MLDTGKDFWVGMGNEYFRRNGKTMSFETEIIKKKIKKRMVYVNAPFDGRTVG